MSNKKMRLGKWGGDYLCEATEVGISTFILGGSSGENLSFWSNDLNA